MKLVTYRKNGHIGVGTVSADLQSVTPFDLPLEKRELGALPIIEALAAGTALPKTLTAMALSEVQIIAPIPKPRRNIFCVGKNYFAHAKEFAGSGFDSSAAAGDIPKVPIYFSKVPESVIGADAAIEIPKGVSDAIDYEVELAVIIGTGGKSIAKADAMKHVWGYTIINDVTARDWQSRHSQWLLGKSFDTFCPMGPWLVSADEMDGANTNVRCLVNGEVVSEADLKFALFDR